MPREQGRLSAVQVVRLCKVASRVQGPPHQTRPSRLWERILEDRSSNDQKVTCCWVAAEVLVVAEVHEKRLQCCCFLR